jgi:polysaccharide export outer membrane protein
MVNKIQIMGLLLTITLISVSLAHAEEDFKVIENKDTQQTKSIPAVPERNNVLVNPASFDPTKYTLGPDDVLEVIVMRHPEFSGTYPVNLEGKIQYKFVGDMDVTGLTKTDLENKLKEALTAYIISPDVNVTILEYRSKVIYVLGEVGAPGKYYMRSESIPLREAVVQAGLPTLAAAMRRCRLITPDRSGNAKYKDVDLYALLYHGDLKKNVDMHPGDVLYVPATVMAKVIRVINPVTSAIGVTSEGPSSVNTAKTATTGLSRY